MGKRLLTLITAAVLAVFSVFSLSGCSVTYANYDKTVFGAGMVFSLSAYGGEGEKAFEEMGAFLDELNAEINPKDEISDIYKFNALETGEKTEVGYYAYYLVKTALEYMEDTGGAYDPTLTAVSELWHVDIDGIAKYGYGGEVPELPTYQKIEDAKADTEGLAADTVCEEDAGKYYLTKQSSAEIDLGAIAKGYAVDECVKIAKNHSLSSALINISGTVAVIGSYYKNGAQNKWNVGVTNPRNGGGDSYICGFTADGDFCVSTSGDYERYYISEDGLRVSHIIDGDRGMPVGIQEDGNGGYTQVGDYVISATVLSGSAMKADIYSTAVTVMGLKKGEAFLKEKGERGIMFTLDKKSAFIGEFDMIDDITVYKQYGETL